MLPACLLGRWHQKKLPTDRKKSYWALQTISSQLELQTVSTKSDSGGKVPYSSWNRAQNQSIARWKKTLFWNIIFCRALWRRHDFLLAHLTANVRFEALNEPFFDRLDMFSNVIDPITTLVALIFAPGGVKVECWGSEKNVGPVVTPVTFPRARIDRRRQIHD